MRADRPPAGQFRTFGVPNCGLRAGRSPLAVGSGGGVSGLDMLTNRHDPGRAWPFNQSELRPS